MSLHGLHLDSNHMNQIQEYAFSQILDFLAFHPVFGPWAIIIGECLKDVGKFMVVLR